MPVLGKSVVDYFKPEFTIAIFIHYKSRLAFAILDLLWMKMTSSGWKMKIISLSLKQYHANLLSKNPGCRKSNIFFRDENDNLMHREYLTLSVRGPSLLSDSDV